MALSGLPGGVPGSYARGSAANGHKSNGRTLPDPLVSAKFWVEIDRWPQGYFRECTGLQLQTEVFEYAEGGLNSYTHKLPVRTKVGNVTLKYGIANVDPLWDWYNEVVSGRIKRQPVTIKLYENRVQAASSEAVAWRLEDALPVKWVGPSFKSDTNEIAVEQLEFVCGAITRQKA